MLRTIFALILISLAAAVCPAQTQTENEYKISPRGRAELQRLAKRFVRRMQQTRDVGPLIPEFYFKDFDVLWEGNWFGDLRLTKGQQIRAYHAFTNYLYLTEM